MVNYNGELTDAQFLSADNRGFLFGDAVFETLRIRGGKILFLEPHYFRMMATMRIVRMEIPMQMTMEYFEEEILKIAEACGATDAGRVRMTVFRNPGGRYLPVTREVSFVITAEKLDNADYVCSDRSFEVDLYRDFHVPAHLLSTLKTNNRMINVTGSVFAHENQLDSCLLVNESKNVVEGLSGNIFMLMGNKLITPPLSEGCLNGIMRGQILQLAKKIDHLEVVEEPISPFDLQKADELFLTNVIVGIQPITRYRKKEYARQLSRELVQALNRLD
jgi:branched-chain amino acid aminotransferase